MLKIITLIVALFFHYRVSKEKRSFFTLDLYEIRRYLHEISCYWFRNAALAQILLPAFHSRPTAFPHRFQKILTLSSHHLIYPNTRYRRPHIYKGQVPCYRSNGCVVHSEAAQDAAQLCHSCRLVSQCTWK